MDMLMSEAFGLWLAQTDSKLNTRKAYGFAIRHAVRFGLARLEDCTLEGVSAYVRALRSRDLAPRTIANAVAALVAVLKAAALAGHYDGTRLELVKQLRPRMKRTKGRGLAPTLPDGEIELLATTAARVAPRLELPIRIANFTAARTGEVARMHRDDFELGPRPSLKIHDLADEWGEARGTAKTGCRIVPVCAELKALVLARAKDGWLFPVTPRRSGRAPLAPFVSTWTLDFEFSFVRRAAGLDEAVKFGWIRHTAISRWLRNNVGIHKVAVWSGNSVKVILDHYYGGDPYDPDVETPGSEAA